MESVEKRRRIEAPAIYTCIKEHVATPDVLAQMHADDITGDDAGERLCLGFQELLLREEEGRAAIEQLAAGEGRAAEAARSILGEDVDANATGFIENALGIDRWENALRVTRENYEEVDTRIKNRIRERGYSGKSIEELFAQRAQFDEQGLNPHLDELIEKEVFTWSSTFGSTEMVYHELVGPREVLRLRDQGHGRFLLLGSFGKYSAQHFDAYAKKVHQNIDTHVIDIDPDSIERIAKTKSDEQTLTQADARMLPFAPGSFDHIYSNNLFHFLRINGMFKTMRTKMDISSIFDEAYAALKPGGSLVIQEQPYARFRKGNREEKMKVDIMQRAVNAGFTEIMVLDRGLHYALVPEAGSSTIDANGFAHYGDALIFDDGEGTGCAQMRFVKSAT